MVAIISKSLRDELLEYNRQFMKETYPRLVNMLMSRGATKEQAEEYLKRIMK